MKILLIIVMAISLYADAKEKMFTLYKNKKYLEACDTGFDNFKENIRDEEYMSLYAFSCLNIDLLDRLSMPISTLKYSEEARSNAAYFSVILMQKKLLYHALIDGYDISGLNLPTTDYILSKVFDLYTKVKNDKKEEVYTFEDKDDSQQKYKLYLLKNDRINKIVIEEYKNTTLIKKHIYW
ncbi:MAG: hypothetical protein A2513_08450 [Sulfurimonas sp. RIFOXYD12_FULL_33_39]|uniref:hypothetical protein n=1 Tax=unclassified Sulfurimonas TaxID=2623549 RepID=UPI0008C38CB1|nr:MULTISPECIES: hypothetical protein [unclassified Sulfurimonas]OHE02490.1 MAG: hypothetical protein A3G74_04135 [Sulfurimonas sp. RIFCSPLOWO2_12_FULL_34_6]OHE10115.1 MAG: hypothetical protein A2513_08450 [Sulfurimonas sp. RIFOXYD12_FULL_33_39]OHE14664.1 MAG: hypothetical protein A2530_02030 [Sulfurimonas sp. RIFOXYD2_FULL_34_21]